MTQPKKIHFMGIGGSAISAVAQIAQTQGFQVSGCDFQPDSPYLAKLKNIPFSDHHDASHLGNCDLLVVSPAIFFQSATHPELVQAKAANKVMTWQEFMGTYLHPNHQVICIAGTHGKSTTATLAGLLLEAAKLDPTVEIGATVPAWNSNVRLGQGKHFVSEADEYYHNFLHYHPDIIILNNIEMDHPEYFQTEDNLLKTFQQFISQLKPNGLLIFNAESPLIARITKPTNSVGYSLSQVSTLVLSPTGTDFTYQGQSYHLQIPGVHNVANALGIIELAKYLAINHELTNHVLSNFTGIGRRLELLGNAKGITVLDDYANHPTAYAATLQAAHQKYPTSKIWAVIEPHTYSRLRIVLSQLAPSLALANHVIISQIFPSREPDPGDFAGADIAAAIPNARYIPEFSDIVNAVTKAAKSPDVILVMGSGDSYKLAREIYNSLQT